MDTKKTILIVLVLIILLALFGWLGNRTSEPQTTVEETKTYQNEAFGYSLSYPRNFDEQEYSLDNVVFGNVTDESVDGVAEARIITVQGSAGQSFINAVTAEMQNLCAADSPNITFSCTGAEQIQPFTSDSGAEGFVFYLRGELRNLQTSSTTSVGKGPYFAFPLRSGATGSTALVIHPPLNQSADEADSVAIRTIAESVKLSSSSEPQIETYIRDNISQLSPIKEQLGGTFYITNLRLNNGQGVVEYEDGHNAYVADFNYSSANGTTSVTNFTIRQQ